MRQITWTHRLMMLLRGPLVFVSLLSSWLEDEIEASSAGAAGASAGAEVKWRKLNLKATVETTSSYYGFKRCNHRRFNHEFVNCQPAPTCRGAAGVSWEASVASVAFDASDVQVACCSAAIDVAPPSISLRGAADVSQDASVASVASVAFDASGI